MAWKVIFVFVIEVQLSHDGVVLAWSPRERCRSCLLAQ